MASCDILDVEPKVSFLCLLAGQTVILLVVPAYPYIVAVRRTVSYRRQSLWGLALEL